MSVKKTAPYGTWASPITTDLITGQAIGLGGVSVDGRDIYWIESRPGEGGRSVLVRRTPDGETRDMTPPPFNVRSRVHEYGGRAHVVKDGVIYFSNFADQRLYRCEAGGPPVALTPDLPLRFADFEVDADRQRLITVREDHRGDGEPENVLAAVHMEGDAAGGTVLARGADFYAWPKLSPDGEKLAWVQWHHPNMPWDGTELWVAPIGNDGRPGPAERIAGGPEESVFQPEWSPDGTLHFVSDRTGWWNLYRMKEGANAPEPLCPMEAEFGLPLWGLGTRTYRFLSDGRLTVSYIAEGQSHLAFLGSGTLTPVAHPFAAAGLPKEVDGRFIVNGAYADRAAEIAFLDPATGETETLKRSATFELDPGYVSRAEAIEFPTENGLTAHAFFYPPTNKDFAGPDGEKPPLIVFSHGGPTGATEDTLSLRIQFWTSRGFAIADVNYGGSTGYGRAYRQRLDGQWGVVDVDDCCNAARFLSEAGRVDPERLAIRGGSAGGYTTLCALTFRDVFKAGASHYGIGDLMALARDTHKFESRYTDRLVGPLPECESVYRERSPVYFTDRLSCPAIFLQGLDDKIVPPNQAEAMVAALKEKGLPVAYIAFEGEGHGFRKAENIKRAMEAELYFYGRVFRFEPAGDIEPVAIDNLP